MPAEDEQLHQPVGTDGEQPVTMPPSDPTAAPLPKGTEEQGMEQRVPENTHREEGTESEESPKAPKVEKVEHEVTEMASEDALKTHDSLTSAQSSSTMQQGPVETERKEPPATPVKGSSSTSEQKGPTAGRGSAVDEEDEEEDDEEDEGGDNEEREERGRSRDEFNNEEEPRVDSQGTQHHNRQDQAQTPTGGQYYDDDEEDEEDEGEERSELRQLFEPINDSQALSEDEEDGDYIPDEEVKKTIMVGSDFQAVIPEGLCRYDDALPYENEDKLLWNPTILNEQEIVDYLLKITSPTLGSAVTTGGGAATAAGGGGTTGGGGGGGGVVGTGQQQQQQKNSTGPAVGADPQTNSVYAIPLGNHLRDDEQSLYLLQQCGHNIDEALRRRRISNNAVPVPEQQMSIWSEEECRNFENGLRVHGKDFHMIQQTKVRTRSVGELVQFYYLWKKTERHDLFASKARLEKKKYNLHPGLTDHMDRFLEEQENSTGFGDRSSSPGFSSLYSSASEAKRQRLLDSKENNNTASSKRGAASNL